MSAIANDSVPRPATRPRWLLPVIALAAIAAGGGGYAWWRSQRVEVPEIALPGIEQRVVEEVDKARAEVIADPKSVDAWGKVGLVLFANDLYPQANPWLEHAEQMNSADPRWPYLRGMVLVLEKPDEALAFFKRAAELSPRDPMIRLRLAETLFTLDQLDEADTAFAEVLRLHAGNPRAQLGLGLILLRRNQPAAAIPLLRQAAENPTARKAGHAALAEALTRTSDDKGAEQEREFSAAAPKDPNWPDPMLMKLAEFQVSLNGRLARAKSLIVGGKAEDGLALAQRVARERPDSAEAHLTVAKGLLGTRQFADAEAALHRALECDRQLADADALLGALYLTVRNDAAGAESHFRAVLHVRPNDAQAHYHLARCRLAQNDKKGAAAGFAEAVRYRPGFAAAHLALGELQLDAGRTKEAIASLEAAAKLDAANDKARDLLAKARQQK
jgi:Flp pilus assembly protein TadD